MKLKKNEKDAFKTGEIDTHEKFMREASKQMTENLNQIEEHLRVIKGWVVFFGIMAILGLILGDCNLIMSF